MKFKKINYYKISRALKNIFPVFLIFFSFLSCSLPVREWQNTPSNIILIIGDGMGHEHIAAASLYASGRTDSFIFQKFPVKTSVKTSSARSAVTDSAAAATAMATGRKVRNGVISKRIPGNGKPLSTVLKLFKDEGKLTGIVTNTHLTHATPAAFAAHADNRKEYDRIAHDYLYLSRPDIMLGGGGYGLERKNAEAAGYLVMESAAELFDKVSDSAVNNIKKAGFFGTGHMQYMAEEARDSDLPTLSAMAEAAVKFLEKGENGFFLLIESGRIDHASHNSNLEYVIPEILELSETIDIILEWASERNDTLIVLTADHETGGLVLTGEGGRGELPAHRWRTKGHSAAEVPLYAWGYMSENFDRPEIDNTDIFYIITGKSKPEKTETFTLFEYNFKIFGRINFFE